MMHRCFISLLFACATSFLAPAAVSAATINWIPIGNRGNAPDTADGDDQTVGIQQFGAVPYSYMIGRTEVTAGQYVEFLNAKDPSGTNSLGLWGGLRDGNEVGGISRNASAAVGSKYQLFSSPDYPVREVTWYSAIRFANWVNNGQGNGDTETGAYTLLGHTATPSNHNNITRSVGATVFLPSEDEWYKAAYYNPATNSYFKFPTSSNQMPISSQPTASMNHANYDLGGGSIPQLVGSYTGTTSPYGGFDMAGNLYEWNESLISSDVRVIRGGSFGVNGSALQAQRRDNYQANSIIVGNQFIGFRLAMVPEPASIVMGLMGAAALGAVVIRKRRARG